MQRENSTDDCIFIFRSPTNKVHLDELCDEMNEECSISELKSPRSRRKAPIRAVTPPTGSSKSSASTFTLPSIGRYNLSIKNAINFSNINSKFTRRDSKPTLSSSMLPPVQGSFRNVMGKIRKKSVDISKNDVIEAPSYSRLACFITSRGRPSQNAEKENNIRSRGNFKRTLTGLLRLAKIDASPFPILSSTNGMIFHETCLVVLGRDLLIVTASFLNLTDLMSFTASCLYLHRLLYSRDGHHVWTSSPLLLCMMSDSRHSCELCPGQYVSTPDTICSTEAGRARKRRTHIPNKLYSLSLLASCCFLEVDLHCPMSVLGNALVALSRHDLLECLRVKVDLDPSSKFFRSDFLKTLSHLNQTTESDRFPSLRRLYFIDDTDEDCMFEIGLAGWARVMRILGPSLHHLSLAVTPISGLFKMIYNHCPELETLNVSFLYSMSEIPVPEIVSYYSPCLKQLELNFFDPKYQRFGRFELPALEKLSVHFGGSSWHWDEDYLQQAVVAVPSTVKNMYMRCPGMYGNEILCSLARRLVNLTDLSLSLCDLGAGQITINSVRMLLADAPYIEGIYFPEEVKFEPGAIQLFRKFSCLHRLQLRYYDTVLTQLDYVLKKVWTLKELILLVQRKRVTEKEKIQLQEKRESLMKQYPCVLINFEYI